MAASQCPSTKKMASAPINPKSAIGFWTAQSCGVDSGFQPRFVSHVGAVALPGRPIAILSIVFGIAEAFFARLPRQRLL
jgi:hypothetical protein